MANYRRAAKKAARRHGLDVGVFLRQIQQESGFNPHAQSGAGARGIAQIMPATARSWGVDPDDPRASLEAAAAHMANYVKQFGSYDKALRAYNAGPGNVDASRGFGETNNYVRTILGGRTPSTSGARAGGGTRTTTTTTPGVDNSRARAQLIQSFLSDRDADPVDFAMQARALKDVAPTTKTRTVRTSSAGGGGGTGGLHGSGILELIYNDGGKGYALKDGKPVDGPSFYSAVWAGHKNHVHVAAGPKTTVELGRLAQSMGLHVGENPHFGGVDPVHAPNSYHYKGEAIDVSGDPAKMKAFARRVKRYQARR